eukprot:m.311283 g.311283  ORF g.311283 m.311283 type:complete len:256 (-) comp20220_c0_seq4:215-982(-)
MSQAADASRQREPDAQKLAESLGNSLDLSIAEKEASLHENIVTVMQLCGARFKEMTEGHLDAPSSKALIDMYKLVLQARRAAGEARVLTAAGKDAQMVDAVARDREEHATTMLSQKTIIEQRADALTKALVDRDAEARAFVYKVLADFHIFCAWLSDGDAKETCITAAKSALRSAMDLTNDIAMSPIYMGCVFGLGILEGDVCRNPGVALNICGTAMTNTSTSLSDPKSSTTHAHITALVADACSRWQRLVSPPP